MASTADVRSALRALLLAATTMLALLALAGAASAATQAPAENRLVAEINRERAAAGLPPLAVDVQLTGVARGWSRTMAAEDRLYHNPAYSSQITGDWQRVAENIGWVSGGDDLVGRMHRAFMDSPPHRANVLGQYNSVGIGVQISASGKLWATVNLALLGTPPATGPIDDAIAVSQREFADDTAAAVVLSRSDVFADALGGAALAGSQAPVLYTAGPRGHDQDPVLHPGARAELDRVLRSGGTVYLLGGTSAVGNRSAGELAADGYDVRRLAGESRIETSLRIAEEVLRRDGDVDQVLLARADAWPDAITGGAYAAHSGSALLLTPSGQLDPGVAAFLDRARPGRVIALGGTAALSDNVVRAAGAERIGGADRVATALAIVERLWGRHSAEAGQAFVAAPAFADDAWAAALAHAPLSARRAAPQLLVGDDVSPAVAAYLGSLGYSAGTRAELHTTRGVPAHVADRLRHLLST